MRSFEFIKNGVRKYYAWGYSEVYMPNPEDCFTSEEVNEVIVKLSALPIEVLTTEEANLLMSLKKKRVTTS